MNALSFELDGIILFLADYNSKDYQKVLSLVWLYNLRWLRTFATRRSIKACPNS